jgi:WD40 repeat protein
MIVNTVGGSEANITDLSFSSDGRYLVGAAGGSAWVWSVDPNLHSMKLDLFEGRVEGNLTLFDKSVTAIAIDPSNSILAVGTSECDVVLYSRITEKSLGTLAGLASVPVKLAFSPDDKQLISLDRDGQIILWDLVTKKPVKISHIFSGAASALVANIDGSISAPMQNTIWTFSAEDAHLLKTTYIQTGKILAVSPAQDVVAGYNPYQVSIYNASTGAYELTLPAEAEDVWIEYYWEGDIIRQFYGALFSPLGDQLITFGTGGSWMYTDLTGDPVSHHEGNNTRKAAFSPDGEWFVAADNENAASPSLVDFSSGGELLPFRDYIGGYYASGENYSQYAFSPDKLHVAMLRFGWDEPCVMEIWDTSTGLLDRKLEFGDVYLLSLAYNPAGTLIAIGKEDGSISLMDADTLNILAKFYAHSGPVTSVVFSRDGKALISASQDGVIKVWSIK